MILTFSSLSGEAAAMNCLMETMTECFDILVFAGLSPEQAATIDLSFLSVAELVDLTCELYGGFAFLCVDITCYLVGAATIPCNNIHRTFIWRMQKPNINN